VFESEIQHKIAYETVDEFGKGNLFYLTGQGQSKISFILVLLKPTLFSVCFLGIEWRVYVCAVRHIVLQCL
jgi:hypothetical protein